MRRRTLPRLGLACAIALGVVSGSALAYFTSGGSGTAAAAISQLTAPTITAASPATGGTVTLTWKSVTAPDGGAVTYYVTRNGGEPAGNCPGESGPETKTTCIDSGLNPGTYEYEVTALWSSWSKTSAVASAKVTVGPVAKFTITGNNAKPVAGAGVNLTITATDAAGKTVEAFTGSHSLVFAGAATSLEGNKAPTVVSAESKAIAFGEPTPLTFTKGVAAAASSKNGYLQIYKAGEANITATEGSLTTQTPLTLNVTSAAASHFFLSASSTTVAAGSSDALTIKTNDAYGNLATTYTGSHNLTFSGASTSPNGNAPTVENSSGTPIAFGSPTAIVFKEGIATVTETNNGEMVLYTTGTSTIKAAEGTTVTTTTGGVAVTVTPSAPVSLALTTTTPSVPTTSAIALTMTAKDTYGNTATSYTGAKNLTFTASGTASETSPANNVPGVYNSAGTVVPFGGTTAITFTNGTVTGASNKNGILRLYKPGTASITVTDGTFTSAPLAFTIATGAAKRVTITGLTASAGTVGSPCFLTCAVTGLGNSGTITTAFTITDEYGNPISGIGAGKTVTVTSTGGTITGSPLAVAETGTATTTTSVTYKSPASGSYTNTITAASTGYTSATITASK